MNPSAHLVHSPALPVVLLLALGIRLTSAFAEPVTAARSNDLPRDDRPAWQRYLALSKTAAGADQAALDAELAAHGMTVALQAPDGGDFKLPAPAGDPWYSSEEARQLADVILSYQTPSGGWSKHTGCSRGARRPGMQWTSQNKPGQRPHYLATFDNRSTTEQMYFLAYVWHATGREDCKAGFIKGLNYILAAQYPNGGWPQVYPLEGGYHDDITFNDDAMTRVLGLLHAIGSDQPHFALLADGQRAQAGAALAAGIRCLLDLQVRQDQKKTVWCAQYDALSLRPSQARPMEPAALSGAESVRILQCLMSLKNPSLDVVAAIESGLAWFQAAKIRELTRSRRDGKTAYLPDPSSTEVFWARFYDLKTNQPIFPGRDGVVYPTFQAMAANNRLGYDYYTTLPGSLLNSGQKKWRKMITRPAETR